MLSNWNPAQWNNLNKEIQNKVLDKLVESIHNIYPLDNMECEKLKKFYEEMYKNYDFNEKEKDTREKLTTELKKFIIEVSTKKYPTLKSLKENDILEIALKEILPHVFTGGNWDNAISITKKQPAVILVCGLNGIRKSSSMNKDDRIKDIISRNLKHLQYDPDSMPSGKNSFFRQLDYVISSITSAFFYDLYSNKPNIDTDIYGKIKKNIFNVVARLNAVWISLITYIATERKKHIIVEAVGNNTNAITTINNTFTNYNKVIIYFQLEKGNIQYAKDSVTKRLENDLSNGINL
jgi:hypothetical protein